MRRKAYRPRRVKARKPAAARARKPARTPPFRAHKGKPAGRAFRAHKPLRHVTAFKAHGKRRIAGHGAVARKVRAVHAKKLRVRKMRRARLVLSLIARR